MEEFSKLSIKESHTKHVTIAGSETAAARFISTTTCTNSGDNDVHTHINANTSTNHVLLSVPEYSHDHHRNADYDHVHDVHDPDLAGVRRSASTSSHYDNINATLHARVKAFQEKRAIKRSASVGSNHKSEEDTQNVEKDKDRDTANEVTARVHDDTRRQQNQTQNQNQSQAQTQSQRQQQFEKRVHNLSNIQRHTFGSHSDIGSSNVTLNPNISDRLQSIPNYEKLPKELLNKSVRNVKFANREDLHTGSLEARRNLHGYDSRNNNGDGSDTSGNDSSSNAGRSKNSSNDNNNNGNIAETDNINNMSHLPSRTEQRHGISQALRRARLHSKPLPPLPGQPVPTSAPSDTIALSKPGGSEGVPANENNNNIIRNSNNDKDSSNNKAPGSSSSTSSNTTSTTTTTTTTTVTSPLTTTTTTTTTTTKTSTATAGTKAGIIHGNSSTNMPPLPLIANSNKKLGHSAVIDPLLANVLQMNPSRQAPRRPPGVGPGGPTVPKQSLSSRRGLKLPPGSMSLKPLLKPLNQTANAATDANANNSNNNNNNNNNNKNGFIASNSCNPGSVINGVQVTSTSSFGTSQRNTEGTTPNFASSSATGGGAAATAGNQFSIFSKYVDIKSGSLNFAGKLSLSSRGIDFDNGSSSHISLDDLEYLGELGHGNYGSVSKVLHKPTHVVMAMKEVRLELDESKFKQILMELEILHKCQSPYIVDFYGAFFVEGAVYMCIEYMDGGSLDKIYSEDPELGGIDEPQLAFIATSVISGLKELKDVHNIIHRDVKPTNILCSASQGLVKLCDFGVSGNLVASMAKTNIGCQSYMAPERIKSFNPGSAMYTVQSDVWSLGLSILEMALGKYPYPPETFDNIFSQLSAIVEGPVLKLPRDKFSAEAQEFVSLCLQKRPERRPNYTTLLQHPWLLKYKDVDVGMAAYVTRRLKIRESIIKEKGEESLTQTVPALHKGGLP